MLVGERGSGGSGQGKPRKAHVAVPGGMEELSFRKALSPSPLPSCPGDFCKTFGSNFHSYWVDEEERVHILVTQSRFMAGEQLWMLLNGLATMWREVSTGLPCPRNVDDDGTGGRLTNVIRR